MEKIYFNGDILTLEEELYADSILIKDDKIYKIGSKDELISLGKDAEIIDLKGRTLMPAFIDTHSHFSGYANSLLQVSLEDAENFKGIQKKIKAFIEDNNIKPGEWVVAKGYDQNNLEEKTHPDKRVIDAVAKDNPVVLQHASGHMGVFNSKALEALNINKDTKPIEGGIIEIKNGEVTGYLEENAYVDIVQKIPLSSLESITKALKKAERNYLSYGITTVQEGYVVKPLCDILDLCIHTKLLDIDLIGYIDLKNADEIEDRMKNCLGKYSNHIKMGGYKIFLDGSPQARTAWMRKPYEDAEDGYSGYGVCTDEELEKKLLRAVNENTQVIAHCNGDKAVEQYLNIYEKVLKETDKESTIRPVIIHAQLLARDQLPKVKELKMIPSFFIAHVYYYGDVHLKNFGEDRAEVISPANSAFKEGIKFTLHQDSPVIEPNMLETIWCAVNRITKSGITLGEQEKVSPLEAIKAVTKNAAYQYFEEDIKGSIKEGKKADLIILDKNPLKVKPIEIKDIQVLETIKDGISLYIK